MLPRHHRALAAAFVALAACAPGRPTTRPTTRPTPVPIAVATADTACFPVERLTPARATLARRVLAELADGEGLYTVSGVSAHGALKPVSSDFAGVRVRVAPDVDRAALDSLAEYQAILPALRCGDVGVVLSVFGATYPMGRDTTRRYRAATLVAYSRPALDSAVAWHAGFFGTLGVVPGADPVLAVAAVEHAPRAPRWRGYGYLFGYPDAAVDFFVAAGEKGDSVDRANAAAGVGGRSHVEPREFRRVETWRKHPECAGCAPTASSFVWAVPRGAAEDADERRLRARAAPVYADYARRRAALGDTAARGIVELLRGWRAGR